jgi:hypothetical protein
MLQVDVSAYQGPHERVCLSKVAFTKDHDNLDFRHVSFFFPWGVMCIHCMEIKG